MKLETLIDDFRTFAKNEVRYPRSVRDLFDRFAVRLHEEGISELNEARDDLADTLGRLGAAEDDLADTLGRLGAAEVETARLNYLVEQIHGGRELTRLMLLDAIEERDEARAEVARHEAALVASTICAETCPGAARIDNLDRANQTLRLDYEACRADAAWARNRRDVFEAELVDERAALGIALADRDQARVERDAARELLAEADAERDEAISEWTHSAAKARRLRGVLGDVADGLIDVGQLCRVAADPDPAVV